MKRISIAHSLLALALASALMGCSKKTEQTQPPPPAAAADTANPAAPAAAPAAQPVRPAAPVAAATDPSGAINAVDAALKAKQYDEAAKVMLSVQTQTLNEQQAAAVRGQMTRLQRDVTTALASGDPKAKAAAEMLRRSSTVR